MPKARLHHSHHDTMAEIVLKLEDDCRVDENDNGSYTDTEVLPILQRFLYSKLPVEDTAHEILNLLPEPHQRRLRGWEVKQFSSTLFEVALQVPYNSSAQPRLVQLVQRLAVAPKLSCHANDMVCHGSPSPLSLPLLCFSFSFECIDLTHSRFLDPWVVHCHA